MKKISTPKISAPKIPAASTRTALSRRGFLRGVGVALSLPLLDAMSPAFAGAVKSSIVPDTKPRGGAGRKAVALPWIRLGA